MSRYRLHTSYLGHKCLVVLYAYLSDESFKVLDTDFDGVYLNANNAIESLEKKGAHRQVKFASLPWFLRQI